MIPASERAKTVHALDRSATVTGTKFIQWINSPVEKRLGREADHSSPSIAKAKNGGATPTLHKLLGKTLPSLYRVLKHPHL
jgi:hypothetical protein